MRSENREPSVAMRTGVAMRRASPKSIAPDAPRVRPTHQLYTVTRAHHPVRSAGDDIALFVGDACSVEIRQRSADGRWAFGSSGGRTGLVPMWCLAPALHPVAVAVAARVAARTANDNDDDVEFHFASGGSDGEEERASSPVPPHLLEPVGLRLSVDAANARAQRLEQRVRTMQQRGTSGLYAQLDAQQRQASPLAIDPVAVASEVRAQQMDHQTWLYALLENERAARLDVALRTTRQQTSPPSPASFPRAQAPMPMRKTVVRDHHEMT